RMKNGAMLINCARGGLVDEQAVRAALDSGKLGAAAFDVFSVEPPPPGHPLVDHPKCVVTPHLGASTEEAQVNVARIVAESVVDFLKTGAVRGAVNLPAISPQVYAEIKPFVELGQQLGSFIAQASRTDAITSLTVKYRGKVAERSTDYVFRSVLSGYLKHRTEDVNSVNAPAIAKRFGFTVTETHETGEHPGLGGLCVSIKSKLGERSVEGTVFDPATMRITRYDGFAIDVPPRGTMLLMRNEDVPGVVGHVGNFFGKEKINIAGFYLGRKDNGGEAVALIEIDGALTQSQLDAFGKLPHVRSVKLVRL
ncbi:MAG: phosphoglycerate dehydrogenase, partial [Planctomycetes bacterium]|nr:phosphoglycerate dehydrogenase [Planctomycetota bacterium]